MTVTNGYPAAPLSTSVTAPSSTTQDAQYQSFEVYDNDEIELVSTARGATKFLSTIIGIGRQKAGGEFANKLGLTEMISKNFPEFRWKEEGEQQEIFVVSATAASGAGSVDIATSVGLIEGNILRCVRTNEQIRVSSVTDADTVAIQRAVGTVAAAQMVPGDKLQVISTSVSKGIATVGTIGVAATDQFNYFQKFLTTVSSDDFDELSNKIRDKSNMDIFMKDRAIVHYRELEKQALFGQKKSGTDTNGKPYYTMEGVIQMASRGWTHDISNSLTRTTLEDTLSFPLRYTKNGSSLKIAFLGTKVKPVLSSVFEGRLQVGQIKDIDLQFEQIEFGNGTYMFFNHPMLDEDSGYDKHMIVVDPAFLKVVYPSGTGLDGVGMNGKTRFVYNKSVETFAYQEGSYVTYMTLMNANANASGLFKIVA